MNDNTLLSLAAAAVAANFLVGCSGDPDASETTESADTSGTSDAMTASSGSPSSESSETGNADTGNADAGTGTGNADTGNTDTGNTEETDGDPGLHPAFGEFDESNIDVYLDGEEVVLETNGLPNHTSPYWGEGHELYVEPQPGWEENATPSLIPGHDGSFTLRVDASPEIAATPSATPLDAIGLAVSGAAIFNEQEGMGILSAPVAAGLDYSGGHIGPGRYHYHTEPVAITDDDDALLGILTDGFFIYGRQCQSTGGYPDDLDEAGGHVSTTQHADEPEYHYHIENIVFLDNYYVIFDGDFQGTPGSVQ